MWSLCIALACSAHSFSANRSRACNSSICAPRLDKSVSNSATRAWSLLLSSLRSLMDWKHARHVTRASSKDVSLATKSSSAPGTPLASRAGSVWVSCSALPASAPSGWPSWASCAASLPRGKRAPVVGVVSRRMSVCDCAMHSLSKSICASSVSMCSSTSRTSPVFSAPSAFRRSSSLSMASICCTLSSRSSSSLCRRSFASRSRAARASSRSTCNRLLDIFTYCCCSRLSSSTF
mmetsp:Transcript_132118/g.254303  ORF Transcript_132118/g.254303 Transcript_132118/m.254303 type:complete len:235 (-) Transcript_132118:1496-2200(-)